MKKLFVSRNRQVKNLVPIPVNTLTSSNEYTELVEKLRKKEYDLENTTMVYHHVIPIAHGGEDI